MFEKVRGFAKVPSRAWSSSRGSEERSRLDDGQCSSLWDTSVERLAAVGEAVTVPCIDDSLGYYS